MDQTISFLIIGEVMQGVHSDYNVKIVTIVENFLGNVKVGHDHIYQKLSEP